MLAHQRHAERNIRTTTEGGTCALLQANLPERFWHKAERHWSTSITVFGQSKCDPDKTRYEAFTGRAFEGYKVPFGGLVHYKRDPKTLGAYEEPGKPALFLGYELGSSFKWTGVYTVLDYEALLKGQFQEASIKELIIKGDNTPWEFPLANAKEENLQKFEKLDIPSLRLKEYVSIPAIGPLRKEESQHSKEGAASSSGDVPLPSGEASSSAAGGPGSAKDLAQAVDPFEQEAARKDGDKHSSDRAAPSAREPLHSDVPVSYPRANITMDRFIKYEGSPGCKAC